MYRVAATDLIVNSSCSVGAMPWHAFRLSRVSEGRAVPSRCGVWSRVIRKLFDNWKFRKGAHHRFLDIFVRRVDHIPSDPCGFRRHAFETHARHPCGQVSHCFTGGQSALEVARGERGSRRSHIGKAFTSVAPGRNTADDLCEISSARDTNRSFDSAIS